MLSKSRTRCRDCGHVCDEPSFSEGPKVVDTETGRVERFREILYLCPMCLSTNLEPINATTKKN